MKQTAVEWLESEMLKPNLSMKEILKQAKELEKQQQGYSEEDIKHAFFSGCHSEPRIKYYEEFIEQFKKNKI